MKCGWARKTRASTSGRLKARAHASPPISAMKAPICLVRLCPARDTGAALVLPVANTEAMQHHLTEISRNVAPGAHAVVLMDQAGWHTTAKLEVPANLSLLFLPPASPELNVAENVWQYLRQTYLGNRVFDGFDAIVDSLCQAWCALLDEPGRIASITHREWACTV